MIKLIQWLSARKTLVIIALCLPVVAFFIGSSFRFKLLPSSPFQRFEVKLNVPNRTAEEINIRVTQVAERVFNGLPGLVSMTAETHHHFSRIELTFNDWVSEQSAYLFVQEKLDRVKLEVPSDVASIEVQKILRDPGNEEATLELVFEKPQAIGDLQKALNTELSSIERSEPDLGRSTELEVRVDPVRLAQEKISISQVTEALKVVGFSSHMGRDSGVLIGMGRAYESIGDVETTIVGVRGQRPVLLRDVAQVAIHSPEALKTLKLWVDEGRSSNGAILRKIESYPVVGFSVKRPQLRSKIKNAAHPVFVLIVILFLQVFFMRKTFGEKLHLQTLWVFNGLLIAHFIFWRGLLYGAVTLLDLHALALTLIAWSMVWMIFFSRIRNYFLPTLQIKKVPRSIEQATLFTLGELVPTFLVCGILFWLFNLPVLTTRVNEPSRQLLSSFFGTGLPLCLIFLILLPILTDFDWVRDARSLKDRRVIFEAGGRQTRFTLIALHCGALVSGLALWFFPVGVLQDSKTLLKVLRGYGDRLEFLSAGKMAEELKEVALVPTRPQTKEWVKEWTVSASGMRFLPHLKLESLSSSLAQFSDHSTFGFLREETESAQIRLRLGSLRIEGADIGELLIASRDSKKQEGVPLRLLASESGVFRPSTILRSRQIEADWVSFRPGLGYTNLKRGPPPGFLETQWSEYVLAQFKKFSWGHVASSVFVVLLMSLYLNSFLRAGILVIFGAAQGAVVMLTYLIWPWSFHSDSLWLLHFVPWIGLLGYLSVSRVVDVERSRGHDRDVALEEARIQFAPDVLNAVRFSTLALGLLGLLEWVPGLPSLGLWREGVLLSALAYGLSIILYRVVFPVVYLRSEEFLDQVLYWVIRKPIVKQVVKRFWM